MPRLGLPSFLLLIGALNAAIVALLLLRGQRHREANRLLAALLAVLALRLAPFILGYAGYYDTYPWLSFAPLDHQLAIGPLTWLYVHRLTTGAMPRRWWWHLVPAGLKAAAWSTIFVSASVAQKAMIDGSVVRPLQPLLTGAALLGLVLYGAAALRRLRAYQGWLDSELSNREEFRLTWLRLLLGALALTGAISIAFAVTDFLIVPLDYWDALPEYLWLSVLGYGLGLGAWRNVDLEYPVPDNLSPESTPATPSASVPDWATIGERFVARIREEEWWRDPQLTLPRLAGRLGAGPSTVSRALNLGVGQSFNECINRLRVEGVQKALRTGSSLDLVQVGFDAGFNSKASFQRAFRRFAGMTPSAYRTLHRVTRDS